MTVTPWEDTIKNGKVLNVFATPKVQGVWLRTFNDAIAKFNELSRNNSLGVTLAAPPNATAPDPTGPGGAHIQFDLGNGRLEWAAEGQKFVAEDDEGNPINFSPFETHGFTGRVKKRYGSNPSFMTRAFIYVPATPKVQAFMKTGPGPNDYKYVDRPVGDGIRLYIAVHEFIHATGLSNAEHNKEGPDADVFTFGPSISAGNFNSPQDDKILLYNNHPSPRVYAPPITIKKKVVDLITANWK